MQVLKSFAAGRWVEGPERQPIVNPTTEQQVAEAAAGGVDIAAALAFARDKGGPALRQMTFAQRGFMTSRSEPSMRKRTDVHLCPGSM